MTTTAVRDLKPRLTRGAKSTILGVRAVLFLGLRYRCPCCGWRVRAFAGQWSILGTSPAGYCPRCNVKARHRRIWRHLENHAELGRDHRVVLEVAPWPGLARALRRHPGVEHHGVDLRPTPGCADIRGDATALPLRGGSFDLVLCVHVLEHVPNDRAVIAEIYRCLREGGLAIVSVPLGFDGPTDEDPSIRDPDERARRFGERDHVRAYGLDLADRLRDAGFDVTLYRESELDPAEGRRFGLKGDENIFHCVKPGSAA
jgi:SAM-dependent methyltransferase